MQPICLGGFVSYFARTSDSDMPISYAYWYATGIVLSSAIYMGIFHPFLLCMFKTAGKMRVACSGLIYQKSLRISKSATKDGQSGAIINLLSTDLVKLNDGLTFLYDVWKGPLEAITFFIVVYAEIGISAAVGFAFLTSFIPLKGETLVFKLLYSIFLNVIDDRIYSMDRSTISTTSNEESQTNRFSHKNHE